MLRFLLKLRHKEVGNLAQQVVASVATIDAVVAVGVHQLTEILVGLNKSLGILVHVLRMHIVVVPWQSSKAP